jgi:tetratricopeptide (TPR) repeat protein/transcriptional regulator with XRE-family HTH domain
METGAFLQDLERINDMKKPAKVAPNPQLKRAREQQGWSQEHVGREIGTDAFTVSRWERGVTMPSPHFRQKLCTLFGLKAVELGLVPGEKDEATSEVQGPQSSIVPARSADSPSLVPSPILDPAIPPVAAGIHGLIGRDELLHSLKQGLRAQVHEGLAALHGLPGVGKTALATVLVHDEEVKAAFSDGILWAGLGYEPDVLGLLSRWGTLLNCMPTELAQRNRPEAWATNIHATIGQRRMLLVIDDAWEIADALAFQVGGPKCAHLITTRFPEIARRFAPDNTIVVHELDNTDGRLLLMRLAPEVVQAEPQEAQALVTAVGGLPLALTLLGNFLRAQAHSSQPRRLRAALERLRRADERLQLKEPQGYVGRHPSLSIGAPLSLQVVIGISDQQVSEEAQAALRAVAVFPPKPNTFSEEAAVAVSALPVETLDELTDAGLVESIGPERYTLHQTIADYARTHLSDQQVAERLVTYYVAYVEAHKADYNALDNESNNIFAALETAYERNMLPELVRGVHAFAPLLITQGLYTFAESQLRRSLQAAQELEDSVAEATAWLHLGKIAEQRGNYVQAQAHWQDGLALARRSEHSSSIVKFLREMGDLAWEQGEPEQARRYLTESLETLRQLGEQLGAANVLKSLGNLAAEQGEPAQAHQLYREALDIFRSMGDQRGTAIILHNLGILLREHGDQQQARQLYEESLSLLRQIGDTRSIASVLGNLGNLMRQQGQVKQANQFLDEALTIHRRMENKRGAAFALLNLGNVALDRGQHEQGRRHLEEALTIFYDLSDRRGAALALQALGILTQEQRQFEQAHQFLQDAEALFHDLQDRRQVALTWREQGLLAQAQEQSGQANRQLSEALAVFEQLGDVRETAVTQQALGALARQQGRLEEAQQQLMEVLIKLRQINDCRYIAHTLKELGLIMLQQEQWQQALGLLLKAGVGLAMVDSPASRSVQEKLAQVRSHMSESTFTTLLDRVANEAPEPAYEMAPDTWAHAIYSLAAYKSETEGLRPMA